MAETPSRPAKIRDFFMIVLILVLTKLQNRMTMNTLLNKHLSTQEGL
jgi:hypothetical protein